MSRAAKTINCSSELRSRLVCTCQKTSSSPIRKAGRCAPSTTVLIYLWARAGSSAGSSWQPIPPGQSRVGSASLARVSSTNCF